MDIRSSPDGTLKPAPSTAGSESCLTLPAVRLWAIAYTWLHVTRQLETVFIQFTFILTSISFVVNINPTAQALSLWDSSHSSSLLWGICNLDGDDYELSLFRIFSVLTLLIVELKEIFEFISSLLSRDNRTRERVYSTYKSFHLSVVYI